MGFESPMRALLVALLLFGQAAPVPNTQDARPVFRSGVSLVRLDVRVVGRDGRPVTDLRPDEVEVTEGGAARPVVLFQRVTGPGGSYVEMAQRTIASDVSTNQGAPQGQLYVLVFDQDHIRPGGELPVRLAAETFLRTRVRPQDRVAIFGLPGPGPAQPFTANLAFARQQLGQIRSGLVRSVNGAVAEMTEHDAFEILRGNEYVLTRYTTVEAGTAATSVAGGGAADVARRVSEDPVVLRRLVRENAQSIAARADTESRLFLRALADLLRSFRGIDGRKTILLFSEGFYGDNVARDSEDVAAAAAETYSVVYAFDLNKRASVLDALTTADDASDTLSRLEPLGGLAAETSGELVKDASVRLDAAFASLLPDDGSYYLLGFEPGSADAGASAYRRVKVRVRRPGARVVTRTGYALGAIPTLADRRRAIDTALAAPYTQQSLKLEYTTYVGQSVSAGEQRVVMSLLAELPVRPAGAAPASSTNDMADVVFVVRDTRTGRTVASGADHLALPDRADAGWSTGSTPWRVGFDLPAGDYVMRCVVREPGGIVGSADRRFTVRALNGFDVGATDFVIASPGDTFPVRARAYTEGLLTGTLRLYGPTGGHLEAVTARLELTAADEDPATNTGRVSEATIGEVVSAGIRSTRDVLFAMPLERLTAGAYVARVIVRVKGEVVADLRRPVDIVLGPAPAPSARPSDATRPRNVLDSEIARRLIRQAASSPTDDVRRGLADLDRENYPSAAAILGLAFDAQPDNAALAFVLGWARVGAGNRTGAVTAFRNAALLEPAMVPAHLALAECYVALGHANLAVQAAEAGLKATPDSIELKRLLAILRK